MISARNFCMKTLLISLAAFAGYPAAAQSWDEIVEWYDAGDYQAALEGLTELADDGDPAAQNNLGIHVLCGPRRSAGLSRGSETVSAFRRSRPSDCPVQSRIHVSRGPRRSARPRRVSQMVSAFRRSRQFRRPIQSRGHVFAGARRSENSVEAARWFRLSAEQCNPYGPAQSRTSPYKDGEGVFKDLVQAHVLFNLAASLSISEDHPVRKDAERFRAEVAKSLSSADRQRAQNAAREWHESSCQKGA